MKNFMKCMTKRDWLLVGTSFGFIVLQVFLDLKLPDYMSEITTLVQAGQGSAGVALAGGAMLLCALGSIVASVVVGYCAARVSASFAGALRQRVFGKTLSFSMEEMNRFSTPSLITRTTNDITQLQTIVAMGLQVFIKAPILAVWALTKIMGKSWQWSALTGIAIVALLILISIVIVLAVPKFSVVQKLTDRMGGVARENLTGMRVIRAHNAEGYQQEKFEQVNGELTAENLFVNRVMSLLQPSMSFLMSALTLGIYWIGARLISRAGETAQLVLFSDMVVFSSYAVQMVMAFMLLAVIFVLFPRAVVSARRINEILNTRPVMEDGTALEPMPGQEGTLELRNVSVRYPQGAGYALKNISFRAEKGETVAIIGATGSGKSTLLYLIPRLLDAAHGEVLVGGRGVKGYNQGALRSLVGYISQKAVLFSGTVRSNIDYGDNGRGEATLSQVKRAVAMAQGADFVEAMEEGYEGAVAQGGTNLSGGQKQRLSIARAICKEPGILLFDDSFSALDYKTDRALREALDENAAGVTRLVVAQRVSTIQGADKIIVLEEGCMVGMGTHRELLRSCPVYQEIAASQLTEEELNCG